jgi:ribonuclease-3
MHELLIFNDANLLDRALTHRSYLNENPGVAGHNERLEFLGDAILTFLSGDYLYRHYPDMREGEMTRRRSVLVDEEQLAEFALQLKLQPLMKLGVGERQSGGHKRTRLLSSMFEAVIGAYYIDKNRDIEALRPLVERLFSSVPPEVVTRRSYNPISQFQELVQASGVILASDIEYRSARIGGSDPATELIVKVYVENKLYGEGRGSNTPDAKRQAAEDAIKNWKNQNSF